MTQSLPKQGRSYSEKDLTILRLANEIAKGGQREDEFYRWLRTNSPPNWIWNWPYLQYIQRELANVTAGRTKRLMLFMPPRHGKSEMVTVRYPVFRLEKDPSLRTIVGAYNQTLADKFSRKSRRIALEGKNIPLNPARLSVQDWETLPGGGYRSTGVGGGVTGMGANLIIIDDPVKSREEANSKTFRDKVWDWYTDDLYTRLEPGGAMILIMTRWHEDDLAGRILASEGGDQWKVISLPAEAEAGDPLGRKVGDPLCPERFDKKALDEIHTVLGKSYWALYQQRPQEQEGDFFKRTWFKTVERIPDGCDFVRYWDRAATHDGGDYTVGALLGMKDGNVYVVDIVRGQWSTGERDNVIYQTAVHDNELYGNVMIWLEQEPGSSGVDVIRNLTRRLVGFNVHADRVTGSKELRAQPFAAAAENGLVYLLKAVWNEAWLDELTAFDKGVHDDQVDASSGAFNKLSLKRRKAEAKSFSWVD